MSEYAELYQPLFDAKISGFAGAFPIQSLPHNPIGRIQKSRRHMSTSIFEAFENHLQSRPEGASPYTVRGYVRDLEKVASWFEKTNGGAMRLRDVTSVDVQDYKAHLQTVKRYMPSTINRRLAALRAYFSWAIDEGLLSEDPVRVRNVEGRQTAPRSISEREYHRRHCKPMTTTVRYLMASKRLWLTLPAILNQAGVI